MFPKTVLGPQMSLPTQAHIRIALANLLLAVSTTGLTHATQGFSLAHSAISETDCCLLPHSDAAVALLRSTLCIGLALSVAIAIRCTTTLLFLHIPNFLQYIVSALRTTAPSQDNETVPSIRSIAVSLAVP
jgi:hypothetical protein